ncbi:uncharacterized mitochondrial protein AtMg00810-like [Arachis hypogaea]|uniref:uncharacterized mitochondrial protein AtMg00810-like n=1 Tax=Arachis hypogaea TaxID=3818 RepID=UPI000DEC793C|nr:uncharacterized protein LOC112754448 [Arachis hypogaea]
MVTRSKNGIFKPRVFTTTLASATEECADQNLPKSIEQALSTPTLERSHGRRIPSLTKQPYLAACRSSSSLSFHRLQMGVPSQKESRRQHPEVQGQACGKRLEGFVSSNKQQVCKLQISLYGLKQAPRAWFTKLSAALNQFGFSSTKSDLVIGTSESEITTLMAQLHNTFSLKSLGKMHYFLEIEVHRSSTGTITLKQTKYIKDLLKKADMSNAKSVPTPMTSSLKLSAFGDTAFTNPTLYRSIVGGLQYATITRPEIFFSVNKVAQFLHNPLESHWKAVKRILIYLVGTIQHGLRFSKFTNLRIYGFCDSDWASDIDDRKSTNGYAIYLGSNLVSWASRK